MEHVPLVVLARQLQQNHLLILSFVSQIGLDKIERFAERNRAIKIKIDQ